MELVPETENILPEDLIQGAAVEWFTLCPGPSVCP